MRKFAGGAVPKGWCGKSPLLRKIFKTPFNILILLAVVATVAVLLYRFYYATEGMEANVPFCSSNATGMDEKDNWLDFDGNICQPKYACNETAKSSGKGFRLNTGFPCTKK